MQASRRVVLLGVICMSVSAVAVGAPPTFDKPFRIGMIGLDTSHVVAFTKIFNTAKKPDPLARFRVVAAFKGGSPDIPSSADRLEKFTQTLHEQFGVEICDTIEDLCKKADGIMLESVDGRPHLAQARPVIKAGLPLYIDKPMAASLADVIEIFRLAEAANVPCWSASSLRFDSNIVGLKQKVRGQRVQKTIAWGPCHREPHHPDLFWYGVHGVEILFTLMGPGCKTVVRLKDQDVVTGTWADGRIGVFDPRRKDYGAEIITDEGTVKTIKKGDYYRKMLEAVAKCFETGKAPITPAETIDLFAFMEAADESKRQGWGEVKIADVVAKAKKGAARK